MQCKISRWCFGWCFKATVLGGFVGTPATAVLPHGITPELQNAVELSRRRPPVGRVGIDSKNIFGCAAAERSCNQPDPWRRVGLMEA
jgi:hypothetical protein